MIDYKKTKAPVTTVTRNLADLNKDTGNIYETVAIVSKRANQISGELKEELNRKLEEFASYTDNLEEVFKQARWIGKNEFIAGNLIRKIRSLFFYSLPTSLVIGIYKSIVNFKVKFIIFKLVYDSAIFISVCKSFFKESKVK